MTDTREFIEASYRCFDIERNIVGEDEPVDYKVIEIRYEKSANQCDGCCQGMPLINGIHWDKGKPYMACTQERYQ